MLLLARKVGERILVDQNTWIEVVGISGNQVKLGFVAPDEVDIVREELIPRVPYEPSEEELVEA